MNRWLAEHLVWPLTERLRGRDTWPRLRALRAADTLSALELSVLQTRKLRRLLRHAIANCPYYREAFAGRDLRAVFAFTGEHAAIWECLENLPILERDDIRQHREAMTWPAARKRLILYATGGSSGTPLQVYLDADRAAADWAARWRARAWWGLRPGDTEILLWGGPMRADWSHRLRNWRDACLNQHVLSAFDLSSESMAAYVSRIRQLRPRCVYGYASSLALLARYANEKLISAGLSHPLHVPGLRAVFTTGEVLTEPDRDVIAAAFGVPVVQEYGCRDGGLLGCACPEGTLHVPAENVIVEVLDEHGRPAPPGQAGDVAITYLETFGMPIIRYRNGDVAVIGDHLCRCGRSSPTLTRVEGRRTDHVIVRRSAGLVQMHALSLIYAVREVEGVRQFRIHQPSLDRLRVDLVPGAGFTADCKTRILSALLQRMGPDVQVEIREHDHLAPLPSGKHVCVTSEVQHMARDARAEGPAVPDSPADQVLAPAEVAAGAGEHAARS